MVIAIYFKDPNMQDDPLSKSKFELGYYELIQELQQQGVTAVVVRGQDTYTGGTNFTRHWTAGASSNPHDYIAGGPITADIIFNRGRLQFGLGIANRVVNHPDVQAITQDKIAAWRLFGDVQAPSRVVIAPADFALLDANKTYVAKIPVSKAGEGVAFGSSTDLQGKFAPASHPLLVQDFIETKAGYPGIITGRHDIRVFVAGGKLVGFGVRPRDKGLDADAGRSWLLPIDQIPDPLVQNTLRIDAQFAGKNRYYCADYFYGDGKWYLIEVNATPGLVPANRGPHADVLRRKLAEYLRLVAESASRPTQ